MSIAPPELEIEYPESDGLPMGETDVHIAWIIRLRDMFKWRHRDEFTYVGAELLVYYEEGDPRKYVVPDVFVVKNCDPGPRRVYKIWEEPSPPQVVIEVTSRGSKREDTIHKPRIYASVGVQEYFMYDPTSEYLQPALQGHRRVGTGFCNIEPDGNGWLSSEHLGLMLRLEGNSLVLQVALTGEPLLTEAQAERRRREREAVVHAAEHAELQVVQEELERLRERLRQAGLEP